MGWFENKKSKVLSSQNNEMLSKDETRDSLSQRDRQSADSESVMAVSLPVRLFRAALNVATPCHIRISVYELLSHVTCRMLSSSGSRGARPPPCPQDFFEIMQFSGNFKGKTPIFEQILGSAPPFRSKLRWALPDHNPGSAPVVRVTHGGPACSAGHHRQHPNIGEFKKWKFSFFHGKL